MGKSKIHPRIRSRIKWFKDLYEEILKDTKDPEIAKIIYRRIVFEEQN